LPADARRTRAKPHARRGRDREMSGGLTFHETMAGPLALGASDPETGAADPSAATLAIHCTIAIDDVDRFAADPEHTGTITGTVDYPPFGDGLTVTSGTF